MTRRVKSIVDLELDRFIQRRAAMASCDQELEQLRDRSDAAFERALSPGDPELEAEAVAREGQRAATCDDVSERRPRNLKRPPGYKRRPSKFQAVVLKELARVRREGVGLESTSHLARRIGRGPGQVSTALDGLSRKGLARLVRQRRPDGVRGGKRVVVPEITDEGLEVLQP